MADFNLPNSPQWVSAPPFTLPAQWVSQSTVLGVPAAWRALNMIANTVATCSPKVVDGFQVITGTYVDNPCYWYTPFEFYSEMAAQLLLHGNWVGFRVYGPDGELEQLVPLPVADMSCRIDNGRPVYQYAGNEFGYEDVLHIRGLTVPGTFWGIGVIEAHRRGLGIALDQMSYQSNGLRTGGVPSAVIELPVNASNFTSELAETVQQDWVDSFAGGQRKPSVIPQGMKVTPLSFSPADMEFLNSRTFSVAEIAFMFGLDPKDLGAEIASDSMTYASLEVREAARLKEIAPWMSRIEQRMTQLLSVGEVKFVPEKQLRADTKSRYESYQLALAAGFMTIDEVRALEGLPPLAPGDDAVELLEPSTNSPAEEMQETTNVG